ncbi:MAG: hypothetical protein AAB899_01430 [Patescibacteria group bacterium]
MRYLFRPFIVAIIALFLVSTGEIKTVFADVAPPPPPPGESATITIRNGAIIISSGSAALPAIGSPDVAITPSAGGGSHNVPAQSVLAVLKDIESATTTFSLSDLQYSNAYSSFYLNCITAPADPASPLCGNWQYVVNGASPGVGMDAKTLSDGDIVYLYFGPSRRITPSSSNVTIGVPFTVLAESYVASSNSWTPATSLTMRILQGDPFGSPTIISSATTGADGRATFTINTAGAYTAGLAEDFYFPNAPITASATPQPPASSSGGMLARPEFDIPLALAYLVGHQRADGSFSTTLLSDWASIAFAGGGAGDAREKLRGFFSSATTALDTVTDYERHAMALQALGINPYSAAGIDYITPIVKAFDKTQVGDPALVNDDIFALFPLMHAGYGANDEIIRKITAFIISKQKAGGSWEESVDMTAAAIQALAPLHSLPNVPSALSSAKSYLHEQQKINAGFGPGDGNSFSTGWAIQAIYALGDSISNWTKNTLSPIDYLSAQQDRDGGVPKNEVSGNTRAWATAYAIPAAERKTWHSLLSSFEKPETVAPKVQEPATTTASVIAPAPVEPLDAPERLPSIAAQKQKQEVFVEQAPEAPVPEPATNTEATTTLASISPPFVQTAAIAIVDYGISNLWKWILAILLLLAFIAGFARGFRKRKQPQKK